MLTCLLSKHIIFQYPYFNVVCVMKRPPDLFKLNLSLFLRAFGLQELVESWKRISSNLNLSKCLGLSSVICFFEIGGKTKSQASILECAIVISWMEIN